MSDDKKYPGPPPDDFSKTTPNINIPNNDDPVDWDKTNYNMPRPVKPADDWGKTVTNIKPIDTDRQDFGKTMYPGARDVPAADWGMTEANINVRQSDFGAAPEEYAVPVDKTTPYFRLPEAERAKYQDLPPSPAERAEQEKQAKAGKGGIPGWFWVAAGLMSMFFFAVAVLLVVYFFVLGDSSFEVTVKNAPPGSDIYVDDYSWGVTSSDGTRKLSNLKAGNRVIKIVHPSFTCETREVSGGNGVTPEPVLARCKEVAVQPGEDCTNIRLGEFDKAERCYNAALEALPDPFTAEDLVRALNILIINFDSGKFEVPPVRMAAIKKGAGYINKLPNVVLEVGGHTDNVGSDAANQALSDNRARAVKEALVSFGVRPESLQTRGYGASQPKTDNSTEEGRFHNRRIQYSVVNK